MLEVLRTDYIKFARARGLSDRAVHFGHALKNTLVPVITITGLQLGSIIAFSIITETVFQWPGVGALFINSVRFVDVPVMAAYLMMIALIFVVINRFDLADDICRDIEEFCAKEGLTLAGKIPFDPVVVEAVRAGEPVTRRESRAADALHGIRDRLYSDLGLI